MADARPNRPRAARPVGLYPCTTPAIGQRVTIEGRGPAESVVGDVLGCYRDPTTGRAGYAVGQTVSRGRVTGALRREARRTGATWDARKGRQQGVTPSGRRAGDAEPRNLPRAPRQVHPRVESLYIEPRALPMAPRRPTAAPLTRPTPSTPERPGRAPRGASVEPARSGVPSFADMVETFAALVQADREAWARVNPKKNAGAGVVSVEEGPRNWFLRVDYPKDGTMMSYYLDRRLYAVGPIDGQVQIVGRDSRRALVPTGVVLADVHAYDWSERRGYAGPEKLDTPRPARWLTSTRKSPKMGARAERDPALHTLSDDDPIAWTPTERLSAGVVLDPIPGMYSGWRGSKYNQNLRGAELGKVIRRDIAAAVEKGALPRGLVVSVTTTHNTVNIEVVRAPGLWVIDPAWSRGPRDRSEGRYTPVGELIVKQLESIANAYNRDNSDLQSDYHDTHFYDHVTFSYELSKQQESDARAQLGEPRVDHYLTRSIADAVGASRRGHPRATFVAPGEWLVEWIDGYQGAARVLASAVAYSPQEALEYARAFAAEHGTARRAR